MYQNEVYSERSSQSFTVSFINKVYGLMTLGLFITAFVAFLTSAAISPQEAGGLRLGAIIFELVFVFVLSHFAVKVHPMLAILMFLAYAALNGFTLSVIFYVYSTTAIVKAFAVTGLTFGGMTVYGTVTRRDLTGLGSLCAMALLGVVIASLVNLFLRSTGLDFALSILGVLIFVGLTAYDTQKIKQIANAGVNITGIAVLGALSLYLDFINLFLYILRLMNSKKN